MTTRVKWTWPHCHEKINDYLLENKDDQIGLVKLLESVGININDDRDGDKRFKLEEIDPFTFYRHIYKHNTKNRLQFLKTICEKIGVKDLPTDTNGIPSVQALKTWLFPFKDERNNHEIDTLWSLFRQAMNDKIDPLIFEAVRKINSVGSATITEALFMVNPYTYAPINGPVKTYCKSRNLSCKYSGYEEYMDLVARIRKEFGADFVEISYDASKYRNEDQDAIFPWKLGCTDKDGTSYQDFMESNNSMNIGWSELGDLSKIDSSKGSIAELLKLNYSDNAKKVTTRKAGEILFFLDKAKVGDYVVMVDGQSALKLGQITGPYIFNSDCAFSHQRAVNWLDHDVSQVKIKESPQTTFVKLKKMSVSQLLNMPKLDGDKTLPAFPLNRILYGPPGTGKTRKTIQLASEIITGNSKLDYKESLNVFNGHLHDRIEFVTFHQNYSYEDFVQGLRPVTEDGNGELSFTVSDGVFKKMADEALQNYKDSQVGKSEKRLFEEVLDEIQSELVDSANGVINIPMKRVSYDITDIGNVSISFRKASGGTGHTLSIATLKRYYNKESVETREGGLSIYYRPLVEKMLLAGKADRTKRVELKNYVLIIDEINRANISRVFGELITLIEKDKRFGGEIPLSCKLPSGQVLEVPPNLYIIGTMNTADKSIALLDIALRRRFEFVPMYPKYEIEGVVVNDRLFLENINKAILKERGKGPDFTIGHSYFITTGNIQYDRLSVFNNKVIPLLMEYFMNDKQKVKALLLSADSSLNILDDGFVLGLTE